MEFYRKDPARAPARLKRQIEENEQHTKAQQRFIAGQEGEKQRINARFDKELARLRELWAPGAHADTSRPSPRPRAPGRSCQALTPSVTPACGAAVR